MISTNGELTFVHLAGLRLALDLETISSFAKILRTYIVYSQPPSGRGCKTKKEQME